MTGPVERMQLGGTVKPTVCPVGLSGADLALMIGRQAARGDIQNKQEGFDRELY